MCNNISFELYNKASVTTFMKYFEFQKITKKFLESYLNISSRNIKIDIKRLKDFKFYSFKYLDPITFYSTSGNY